MALYRQASNCDQIRTFHMVLAALIVLTGAWFRMRGAFAELWLDEIWSLNNALTLNAWHEPFWKIPHDNNHPLNTWWLYMMGPGRSVWVYHLFSVITGTLTVVVAGWVAARNRAPGAPKRMLVAMILMAVLFPFVNYGSEARGYGPVMLFAVLAYASVEAPDTQAHQARWGYGIAGILGLLSHLGILPILFALSLCFAWRQRLQGHSILHAVNATVHLNGPFLAGLLVYVMGNSYGIHLNANVLEIGGSTLKCPQVGCFVYALDEITRFTTGGFGAHKSNLHSGFYIISVLGGVAWLGAVGNRRALPLGFILLGVPLVFFVAGQPASPHGRYFIFVFVFVPLLIGEIFGELSKRSMLIRFVASICLVVFVGANGWAINRFLKYGRGDYERALNYITQHSDPSIPLLVGTEMTYQLGTVMDYNLHRLNISQTIRYIPFGDIPKIKPRWVVSVSLPLSTLPQTACTGGLLYRLESRHPYWGMSGKTWGIYALSPSLAPTNCRWLTNVSG